MNFFALVSCFFAVASLSYGQNLPRVITTCSKEGIEVNYTAENIKEFLTSPVYNNAAKLVVYVYAVLPESTSMFTEYRDHLTAVKKAYEKVPDNFLYIELDGYLPDIKVEIAKLENDSAFVAFAISNLLANGLSLSSLELIGFSMGGQIVGIVGQKFSEVNNKLPTIISLEPSLIPGLRILDLNDADFVMTVRTEYRFNDPNVTGHVNFFFNKELIFKQCFFANFGYYDHRCAQERLQLMWAEAVASKNPNIFPAIRCENLENFNQNICESEVAFMNPFTPHDLRGNFFGETDPEAQRDGPFHKDLATRDSL